MSSTSKALLKFKLQTSLNNYTFNKTAMKYITVHNFYKANTLLFKLRKTHKASIQEHRTQSNIIEYIIFYTQKRGIAI